MPDAQVGASLKASARVKAADRANRLRSEGDSSALVAPPEGAIAAAIAIQQPGGLRPETRHYRQIARPVKAAHASLHNDTAAPPGRCDDPFLL